MLPAFNRAGTIEAAIRSVLAQTFLDLEVIVVDDGSQDGTAREALAVTDPRLSVLALPQNAGASVARNVGICAGRAPFVAFQDSDDLWRRDKLAKQMQALTDTEVIATYCGMTVEDPGQPRGARRRQRIPSGDYPSGGITEALLWGNAISTQTLVVRREALDIVGLFDPAFRSLQDWELALRLSQAGRIEPVRETLVDQRISGNSLTRQTSLRARAHCGILQKHAPLFARTPRAAARQWEIVAGRFRRIGAMRESRHAALTALRIGGLRPRPVAQYLTTFLP